MLVNNYGTPGLSRSQADESQVGERQAGERQENESQISGKLKARKSDV